MEDTAERLVLAISVKNTGKSWKISASRTIRETREETSGMLAAWRNRLFAVAISIRRKICFLEASI